MQLERNFDEKISGIEIGLILYKMETCHAIFSHM